MAVRTMVVWCADWPVVAARCAPGDLVAVVAANRVVACTPASRAAGVAVGQRRRDAQGRCSTLMVLERDDSRDVRAFEAVVRAVEVFTPRLELTVPGRCAFATRGPSRYFGGDESLARQVGEAVDVVLRAQGWRAAVRVGVADGPFAAELSARRAPRLLDDGPVVAVVNTGASPVFLADLPIDVLARPDLTGVLVRLGLTTLGAYAALPAADVVARFGAEGLAAHRLAAGLDERPPDSREPPPELMVASDVEPPADRVDVVAFLAKTLADELFTLLGERGLGCTRVIVSAETEHGELCERLWRHDGELSAGAMADRVRWQLDGWLNGPSAHRPTAGITRLVLTPDEVVPALGRQLGFWGAETDEARRAARALARLTGLLGPDAVCVPEWRGGRGPAEQFALVPAAAVDLVARTSVHVVFDGVRPWPGKVPAPHPAVVHPSPSPVEIYDAEGEPVCVDARGLLRASPAAMALDGGPGRTVVAWAGPWPCDERWWDAVTRRRRARLQVVLEGGDAHLVAVESGRWWLEATYD